VRPGRSAPPPRHTLCRGGGSDDEALVETAWQKYRNATFGAVCTVWREQFRWEHSVRFTAARIVLESLQLYMLLLQPAFGWMFSGHST